MLEPPVFALPGSPNSSRLRSFLLSLCFHAGVVAMLIAGPNIRPVDRSAPRPTRVVPSDRKIIWYTRTVELPAVAPTDPAPPSAKPRLPEFHPRQNVAASAAKPESRRQMVLQAPPELRLTQDIPSPNVLIFNPLPKPRFQVKASARAPLQRKALPEMEAPQLKVTATPPPVTPPPLEVARPALPRFQPPQLRRTLASPQALDAAAPKLVFAVPKDELVASVQPKVSVERPRFIAPEAKSRRSAPVRPAPIAADEAPAVAAMPQQPTTVIVGLDPVPGPVAPPPGNRAAQFGAGPETNGNGAETLTASANAQVRVPNLAIAPAAAPAAAPTVTRPPLPNIEDRSKLRRELLSSVSARPRGAAFARPARSGVPSGPEMILNGATVYSMNIDMPNITSYEGSWVLRFTEVGGSSPDDMLSAPLPTRKIDPKYAQSAVAEGVEGKVLLYAVIHSDGRVDQVRLVQGVDERLDSSAVAAFSKWEFQPATRNGQPVDLEAVVQIPFKAGPRKKR